MAISHEQSPFRPAFSAREPPHRQRQFAIIRKPHANAIVFALDDLRRHELGIGIEVEGSHALARRLEHGDIFDVEGNRSRVRRYTRHEPTRFDDSRMQNAIARRQPHVNPTIRRRNRRKRRNAHP